MSVFRKEEGRLIYHYDAEEVWIEPWSKNSLRIRATKTSTMPLNNWALLEQEPISADVIISEHSATVQNGNITAVISSRGKLLFYNHKGELLLEEYVRNRSAVLDPKASALGVEGREFKPYLGCENYHLTVRFETVNLSEKIYGMGQYQQPYLDLMGTDLELAQRNSQASVPFMLSSMGYGMLWNNPSVGRVVFGKNIQSWEAYSTTIMDYWITVADTPAQIEEAYANVTGKVPMMPEYGLGFWQCKYRYQTQEELLEIAREYKRRDLPIDVIVIDFFHWTKQGEWKFDPIYWPNPDAMVKELNDMGIELMVSIWPTVDKTSENYEEMLEKGYLIRTDRGVRVALDFQGATIYYDSTNPKAREFLWNKVQENYYEKGIRVFWLDEAEPEYTVYDFDNYRYFLGSDLQIGNIYPVDYAKTFYEGMKSMGQKNIVNLIRCAWAGSQKYGALVWSGDIASSFQSMRNQLAAGLNMGIAGIPWWTTDIGGFHGGNPEQEDFRELFVRWFQWATYCPVMRLHGDREPRQPQFRATLPSGAPNEVWSYGEKVYEICKEYLELREEMRDYTRYLMEEAHIKGTPVIRTLFYEFPQDKICWNIEDEYMYGNWYLVAPILTLGARSRTVYFPDVDDWQEIHSNMIYQGGTYAEVDAPIEYMPVFVKVN